MSFILKSIVCYDRTYFQLQIQPDKYYFTYISDTINVRSVLSNIIKLFTFGNQENFKSHSTGSYLLISVL